MKDNVKKIFTGFLQLSTWIFSIISPFILAPPGIDADQDTTFWVKFSQVMLALLIGLLYIPATLYVKKKYLWKWWGLALVTTIAGISMVFWYKSLRDAKTISIERQGKMVKAIIGNKYTDSTIAYKKTEELRIGRKLTNKDLIREYAALPNDYDKIWIDVDVNQRELYLTYTLTLIMFSISIITVVQAVKISSK